MSFEVDEDILQDFLVEAGEILEQLSEQLVELENNPDDADLLNAIFRGFHTVKGGAGFLSMTELVDACHGAENIFDVLRQGQRAVTPELMDVILQALDTINDMFAHIQNRAQPEPADPTLLAELHRLSQPDSDVSHAATATPDPKLQETDESDFDDILFDNSELSSAEESSSSNTGNVDDITEDEFESLLDELHGAARGSEPSDKSTHSVDDNGSDEITDDEFESLLDELHGAGNGPADNLDNQVSAEPTSDEMTDDEFESLLDELHGVASFGSPDNGDTKKASSVADSEAVQQNTDAEQSGDDSITEEEFEALLDELHGKGSSPSVAQSSPTPKTKPNISTEAATKPVKAKPLPTQSEQKRKAPVSAKPVTPPAETTVRVDTKRLDQIMNMVGELVLVRNRLVSLGANDSNENMGKAISNLDVVTADLQGAVMKTRMQPIKKVFGRFPRVVRDLARSLKKEINLQLIGEDTDLDKNLVEALADPLVHLVRNSVDHGIEMPDEREDAGKPRSGTVTLSASQEGDHILLTIEDDGAGMDAEKLKSIAIDKGVLDAEQASRLTDNEAYNLIFAPGFSTKEEISDISGRGVGMDVVKTKITQLNGTVNIESERGKGTILEIKVPLTLAILPTLMVVVGKQTFALPLAGVSEIFNLDLNKTNVVDGQLTIIVRDKAIPLFYLEKWLLKTASNKREPGQGHVVIVQLGTQQIGFVVDSLIGQEEVVIKPLDTMLQGTPGMAGATITSDGGIALILDVPSLLKHYAGKTRNKN